MDASPDVQSKHEDLVRLEASSREVTPPFQPISLSCNRFPHPDRKSDGMSVGKRTLSGLDCQNLYQKYFDGRKPGRAVQARGPRPSRSLHPGGDSTIPTDFPILTENRLGYLQENEISADLIAIFVPEIFDGRKPGRAVQAWGSRASRNLHPGGDATIPTDFPILSEIRMGCLQANAP